MTMAADVVAPQEPEGANGPAESAPTQTLEPSRTWRTSLDYIRNGRVYGWSLEMDTLVPAPIEIYCDQHLVGIAACEGFRGDLFNLFGAQVGAFDVELPAWVFDGFAHQISVHAYGVEATGSPRTLSPAEQTLYRCSGSVQTNGATHARLGAGVTADLLLSSVLASGSDLSPESRSGVGLLTGDLLIYTAFGTRREPMCEVATRLLARDVLTLDRPSTLALLIEVATSSERLQRDELRRALGLSGQAASPYARLVLAALHLAEGEGAEAERIVLDAARASGHAETVCHVGASLLINAGRGSVGASVLALSPVQQSEVRRSRAGSDKGGEDGMDGRKGAVEFDSDSGTATGWLYDEAEPHTVQSVEILIDGALAAVVTANLMSMGVIGLPLDASYNGFEFRVPPSYLAEGRMHIIRVRSVSGVELQGSPFLVEPMSSLPGLQPQFRLVDRAPAIDPDPQLVAASKDWIQLEPTEPLVIPPGQMGSNRPEIGGMWGHKAYQPWPSYFAHLSDVFVDPVHGNVFNRDGELWAGCHYLRNTDVIAEARARIAASADDIPQIAGDALIFSESVYSNYWHWHTDCLPTLHQATRLLPLGDVTVLAPPLADWQRQSAEMILRASLPETEGLVRVDGVYCSSYLDGRSIYPDAGVMATFGAVRAAVERLPATAKTTRSRILVSRKDASDRVLENEDELAEALVPLGFERVLLRELDYPAKVRLFAQAEIMVGSHGAGFTNVGFCHQGASVFEIVAASRAIGAIRYLAARAGLNHHWYSTSDEEAVRLNVPAFVEYLVTHLATLDGRP
jgi:capsular polysaccharide biosynthesis protein